MNESKTMSDPQSCENDVTHLTDLNGITDADFHTLTPALRDAICAVRARHLSEGIGDECGVACPRCGARAYLERAENGLWILVGEDGSPHSDACPPAEGQAEIIVHPPRPFDPFAT
ncbi:MAG TPA: hypothetical protein VF627_12995 [Abditibacterium sp.]|jgi:hypothetical protein